MSRRDHLVLRFGALALLALAAWFPRGAVKPGAAASAATLESTTTLTSATWVVPHGEPVEVASIGR